MNVKTTTKGKMTISLTKPEHELLMRSSVTVGALARVGDKDAADAAALLSRIRSRYEKPFVIEPETKPSEVGAGESSGGETSAGESQDSPGADALPPATIPSELIDDLDKCQSKARVASICAAYQDRAPDQRTKDGIFRVCEKRIAEIEATKA